MSEDDVFKRNYLIQTAFECHLDLPADPDDVEEIERRRRIPKCQLCRVKVYLNEYESTIFDKYIVMDNAGQQVVQGSWNANFHEIMLRMLYTYAKKEKFNVELMEQADESLKMLEAVKEEFKAYSQYWVEINYSAAACDELNMCKSRLEAYDLDEIEEQRQNAGRNANMRIPIHLVIFYLFIFISDIRNLNEMLFTGRRSRRKAEDGASRCRTKFGTSKGSTQVFASLEGQRRTWKLSDL